MDHDTVDSASCGLVDSVFAFAEKLVMCTKDNYSYTENKGWSRVRAAPSGSIKEVLSGQQCRNFDDRLGAAPY